MQPSFSQPAITYTKFLPSSFAYLDPSKTKDIRIEVVIVPVKIPKNSTGFDLTCTKTFITVLFCLPLKFFCLSTPKLMSLRLVLMSDWAGASENIFD